MDVKGYFICFSLKTNVEHLFMCSLDICVLSLGKYLFISATHYKIGLCFYC